MIAMARAADSQSHQALRVDRLTDGLSMQLDLPPAIQLRGTLIFSLTTAINYGRLRRISNTLTEDVSSTLIRSLRRGWI